MYVTIRDEKWFPVLIVSPESKGSCHLLLGKLCLWMLEKVGGRFANAACIDIRRLGNHFRSMPTTTPTLSQIQSAIAIAERIQQLEEELAAVMGGESGGGRSASSIASPEPVKRGPGRPPRSAAPATQPVKRGPGRPPKSASPVASPVSQPAKTGRKPFSAEARAKMAAAARARWAGKSGAASVTPSKPAKAGKRTMSDEVRARLAAAMKARWALAKKKGLPGPNARK